jgi:hypothetical protein
MSNRYALGVVVLLACAPAARAPSTAVQQGGEVNAPPPTDEQIAYGRMAAVAIKQSRFLTLDKTVGVYQWDDRGHPLHPIVREILDANGYREIHKGQMQLACSVPDRPGLRGGTRGRDRVCGLDRADVLMQVMSVQIMRDSGYVGGYLTQVYRGEDRPKTSVFCFIAVWRQQGWQDVHNSLVKEPQDCTFGRKH